MTDTSVAELNAAVAPLVDAWCERRAIGPLRVVLGCYPVLNALTDDWAALAHGLKTIRAQHGRELPPLELEQIIAAQHLAEAGLSGEHAA